MLLGREPGCCCEYAESKIAQIQSVNKRLNSADGAVFSDLVIKRLGLQRDLTPIFAIDKMLHRAPPMRA